MPRAKSALTNGKLPVSTETEQAIASTQEPEIVAIAKPESEPVPVEKVKPSVTDEDLIRFAQEGKYVSQHSSELISQCFLAIVGDRVLKTEGMERDSAEGTVYLQLGVKELGLIPFAVVTKDTVVVHGEALSLLFSLGFTSKQVTKLKNEVSKLWCHGDKASTIAMV